MVGNTKEGAFYEGALVSRVFYRKPSSGHRAVIFRCSCGEDFERTLSNQRKSVNKVCNSCTIKLVSKAKVKYKDDRHNRKLYGIWKGMNTRCYNKSAESYPDYGGRGITVCDEWRDTSPENYYNFLNHVWPRPSDNHSIDRVDNNKGYDPSNVEWKTSKQQMSNVRSNHIITFNGKEYTLVSLAEEYDIKANTLLYRLRRGWSVDEAIKGERVKEFKRPYADIVNDSDFYEVLKSVLDKDITLKNAGNLLGVEPSHLSRIRRDQRTLDWLEDYEKRL